LVGRSNRVSCISAHDPQLARLADAIAQRVGQQRFHVWFNNSTRLDLKQDGLEIAVPNDFISDWIGKHYTRPIQEAAHEVLGCSLPVRFCVVPQLFDAGDRSDEPASPVPASAVGPNRGKSKNFTSKKVVPATSGRHASKSNGQNGVAVTAVAAATVI